jgi:hypothetical protein
MTLEEAQKVQPGDSLYVGEEWDMMPLDHHTPERNYVHLGYVSKIINTDNDINFHVTITNEYHSGVFLLNYKYCITHDKVREWKFEKWFNKPFIQNKIDLANTSPKELMKLAYLCGLAQGTSENDQI